MRIPAKVRITPKTTYEISWVDSFDHPDTVGECRFDSKQIVLKNGESKRNTEKTLIHEMIHSLEFEYDLKIPHDIIYKLENVIHRVFKLNGWIS